MTGRAAALTCLTVATALGAPNAPALAAASGTRVTQEAEATEVTGEGGKKTRRVSSHEWLLAGNGRFRLKVVSEGSEALYLFNGKTLYLCGQLQEEAQKRLVEQGIGADLLKARFSKGACQAAPTNFLVRFTLSPLAAAESVDITDGLRLTLGVNDYKADASSAKAKQVAGTGCTGLARSYLLTRTDASGARPELKSDLAEDGCVAGHLLWRQDLATETAKFVLRQPGGAALAKLIREDAHARKGLPLEWSGSQSTVTGGGQPRMLRFTLKTTAVEAVTTKPEDFNLPLGFGVFSPESIALFQGGSGGETSAKAQTKKEESVLDTMQSVFFCAIAGRLGCFAP